MVISDRAEKKVAKVERVLAQGDAEDKALLSTLQRNRQFFLDMLVKRYAKKNAAAWKLITDFVPIDPSVWAGFVEKRGPVAIGLQ